ncbi:MAG: hypothetical protein SGPRY_011886 [Prymnesium sp.]
MQQALVATGEAKKLAGGQLPSGQSTTLKPHPSRTGPVQPSLRPPPPPPANMGPYAQLSGPILPPGPAPPSSMRSARVCPPPPPPKGIASCPAPPAYCVGRANGAPGMPRAPAPPNGAHAATLQPSVEANVRMAQGGATGQSMHTANRAPVPPRREPERRGDEHQKGGRTCDKRELDRRETDLERSRDRGERGDGRGDWEWERDRGRSDRGGERMGGERGTVRSERGGDRPIDRIEIERRQAVREGAYEREAHSRGEGSHNSSSRAQFSPRRGAAPKMELEREAGWDRSKPHEHSDRTRRGEEAPDRMRRGEEKTERTKRGLETTDRTRRGEEAATRERPHDAARGPRRDDQQSSSSRPRQSVCSELQSTVFRRSEDKASPGAKSREEEPGLRAKRSRSDTSAPRSYDGSADVEIADESRVEENPSEDSSLRDHSEPLTKEMDKDASISPDRDGVDVQQELSAGNGRASSKGVEAKTEFSLCEDEEVDYGDGDQEDERGFTEPQGLDDLLGMDDDDESLNSSDGEGGLVNTNPERSVEDTRIDPQVEPKTFDEAKVEPRTGNVGRSNANSPSADEAGGRNALRKRPLEKSEESEIKRSTIEGRDTRDSREARLSLVKSSPESWRMWVTNFQGIRKSAAQPGNETLEIEIVHWIGVVRTKAIAAARGSGEGRATRQTKDGTETGEVVAGVIVVAATRVLLARVLLRARARGETVTVRPSGLE